MKVLRWNCEKIFKIKDISCNQWRFSAFASMKAATWPPFLLEIHLYPLCWGKLRKILIIKSEYHILPSDHAVKKSKDLTSATEEGRWEGHERDQDPLTALKVWDKKTPRSCWTEGGPPHHLSLSKGIPS